MQANIDEKFLYELCANGADMPGYYRLKRCLIDFERVKAKVHTVLDAGCGGGAKSIYLARNYPSLSVVGTDINEGSIKNAEGLRARYQLNNTLFLQRDMLQCNELGTFDFVIISDVLEHIENDAQVAVNVDKMLEPGGFIHINVPCKEHDYDFSKLSLRDQKELSQWMKDIGHVRLGYTFDEIQVLFPRYEIIKMKKVGNCCCKVAYFFWEKVIFDPSRKQPVAIKKEYKFPFVEYIEQLINSHFVRDIDTPVPQPPLVNERMFLQAMRTIDLGIEMEDKGLLDKRYLIEEEVCCLLRKPIRN